MNLPLFIARRIYSSADGQQQVSRPAIRIATVGVTIGLAVMIITISVVYGFKHTIRDKVVGFGSHIQVQSLMGQQTTSAVPVSFSDSLISRLSGIYNVRQVERYSLAQGILKTEEDFLGVVFKGVGPDYDTTFLRESLIEGSLPVFSDSKSKYPLLISQKMARQLNLKVGDKVYAYFVSHDDVRPRRFRVVGIYQSDMKNFDDMLCFTDFSVPVKLNDWEHDQCSGLEILVNDFDLLDQTADAVAGMVNHQSDQYGESYTSQTIQEAYPQIFTWLSLLDINVWIILGLMVCVAGFTMISGLLIIILERTQMIGVLKALGARNRMVRHTFLWFAAFIIGRGILFGDIIGVGLVLLQQQTGVVRLDPASYYVDTAPVELNIPIVVILNIATMLVCVTVLIAPSFLISHIHPARSMRYE